MRQAMLWMGAVGLLLCIHPAGANEVSWLAGEQTEIEQRVEAALGRAASLDVEQVSFDVFIVYVRDITQLDIVIDRKAWTDAGVSTDTEVTIKVEHASLKSALALVLDELDMTWLVRDGVVLITSKTEAENWLATKIYDVGDMVGDNASNADYGNLVNLVTCCIAPTTWDEVGGPGSIQAFQGPGIRSLVVSQTREAHEDIASLFADLRRLAKVEHLRPTSLSPRWRKTLRSSPRARTQSSRNYANAPAWSTPQIHE